MSLDENYEIVVITADGENWKKEKVSVAGVRRWLSEWMSSGYKEKMIRLRDVDHSIQEWAKILKTTVKELKRAFRTGRIIDVAILFGRLNKNLKSLVEVGGGVNELYEEALSEFEGEHELSDYDVLKEFDKKEAAFLGDLARKYIGSRFYGKEIRERNMAIRRLIAKAEYVYKTVEGYLDEMRKAKNAGDIGRYVDLLKNISDKQKEFQDSFIPVYDKYLRKSIDRILEKQKKQEMEKKDEPGKVEKTVPMEAVAPVEESSGLVGNRAEEVPFMAPPEAEEIPFADTTRQVVPIEDAPPTPRTKRPEPRIEILPEGPLSEEKAPQTDKDIEEAAPLTMRSHPGIHKLETGAEMDEIMKEAHEEFVKSLASLKEPKAMAVALLKYAELIEDDDLETSLKLMAIAEGII
jgi:hypothetical protein